MSLLAFHSTVSKTRPLGRGVEGVDISLSLCLNTDDKEGKATKGFRKLIAEAKGFSTRTTTKEGKR
jgi:hypothetical protein